MHVLCVCKRPHMLCTESKLEKKSTRKKNEKKKNKSYLNVQLYFHFEKIKIKIVGTRYLIVRHDQNLSQIEPSSILPPNEGQKEDEFPGIRGRCWTDVRDRNISAPSARAAIRAKTCAWLNCHLYRRKHSHQPKLPLFQVFQRATHKLIPMFLVAAVF